MSQFTEEELERWVAGEATAFEADDEVIKEYHSKLEQIDDTTIIVKKLNGCQCSQCHDFVKFAEPNQDDGSFKCWSCRKK